MGRSSRTIEVLHTEDGLWVIAGPSRARLTRIAPSVARIDVEGHAHEAFAPALTTYLSVMVSEVGRVYLGVDADGMRSYDGRFRYLWTEWFKQHSGSLDGVLVLFRSRIVLGGTIIVNAVAGRKIIEAVADRARFEDRLAEAMAPPGDPCG